MYVYMIDRGMDRWLEEARLDLSFVFVFVFVYKLVLLLNLYCNCCIKILFLDTTLSSQFFKIRLSLRFDKTEGCFSQTRISNVRAAQGRNVHGYVWRMKTSKCLDAPASLELTQENKSVGLSLIS